MITGPILPAELILIILEFLKPQELSKAALINNQFKIISQNPYLWKTAIKYYFPFAKEEDYLYDPRAFFITKCQSYAKKISPRDRKLLLFALSGNLSKIEQAKLNPLSKIAVGTVAVLNGHESALKFLDPESIINLFRSAIGENNLPVAKMLLTSSKDIIPENDIAWALTHAIEQGKLDLMLELLPYVNSQQMGSALCFTAIHGRLDLLQALLLKFAKKISNYHFTKTLFHACSHGHLEMVKSLLQSGRPIDPSDQIEVIFITTINGHGNILQLLQPYFNNQTATGADNTQTLLFAALSHFEEVAQALHARRNQIIDAMEDENTDAIYLAEDQSNEVDVIEKSQSDIEPEVKRRRLTNDIDGEPEMMNDNEEKNPSPLLFQQLNGSDSPEEEKSNEMDITPTNPEDVSENKPMRSSRRKRKRK